jgi:hypothetical protein
MFVDPRTLATLQASVAQKEEQLMFGSFKDLAHRFATGRLSSNQPRATADVPPPHYWGVPRMAVIDFKGLVMNIAVVAQRLGLAGEQTVLKSFEDWAGYEPQGKSHGSDQKA